MTLSNLTLSNDLLLGLILGSGGTLVVVGVIQLWQGVGRVSKRLTSPGCLIAFFVIVVLVIVVLVIAGGAAWQTGQVQRLW